jgi:undecaprenyl-diphosphatase
MTAALFRGFTREAAARYSFLISIPLIGGISALKTLSLIKHGVDSGMLVVYASGLIAAFVSGYLCIKFLLDYLKKGSFTWFVIYRVLLGLALIFSSILGFLK